MTIAITYPSLLGHSFHEQSIISTFTTAALDSDAPTSSKFNLFERREQMERVANKLLKGAKATVAMKVFQFFLSKADNATGISRHSIETISQYISYCKQWTQEGINLCVRTGLITRIRRGIKKTNIYMINYELIGKHSYKPHKCLEGVSIACQSSLSKSKYNSITIGKTSFEKNILSEYPPLPKPTPQQHLATIVEEPKEITLSDKDNLPAIETTKECIITISDEQHKITERRKWKPEPANRTEELEFFKEFTLSKKSTQVLKSSVFNKFWVTNEYMQAYKCYIENNRPPFREYGEFWNHRNANRYFPLWLKGTIQRKKLIESQGKTFFHYHDRMVYKKVKPYFKDERFGRSGYIEAGMSYNFNKSITPEQLKIREEQQLEVLLKIELEPDKIRQNILKVCADMLPASSFLLAEKSMKVAKIAEDEEEINLHIFMEHVYSFEQRIERTLEQEFTTKEKRAYVRISSDMI